MTRFRRPTHNAIPLGRLTIAAQLVTALAVAYFLFDATGVRVPVAERAFTVRAFVPDAAGLHPPNRPAVTVAGVASGKVRSVTYDTRLRQARIELELDEAVRGKLFNDASIRIAPRSALNDLVVKIRPGTPSAGRLRGGTIRRSAPAPVGYDRVLGVLDADTRAYAQILIGTLERVLRDRPGDLRDAIRRLPNTIAPVDALSAQLARRRANLSQLVGDLDAIVSATASRSTQLTSALVAARRTLAVTARRQREVERTVAALPGTLEQADATFGSVERLGRPLVPALTGLRGTVSRFPSALAAVDELLPTVRSTTVRVDDLAHRGRAPLGSLRRTAIDLDRTLPALRPLAPFVRHLVNTAAKRREEFTTIMRIWPGALAGQNTIGPLIDFAFVGVTPYNPQLFGLPKADPAADRKLEVLVGSLAKRHPKLFAFPPALRKAPVAVRGLAAAVNSMCQRGNDTACLVIAQLYARPPKVVSPR